MKRTNQRSDFSLNNKLLDDWRVVPGDLATSPRCMPVFILLGVYHVYLRYISTSSSSSQIFGQTYLFDNVGKFYLRSGSVSDNVRSHV